MKKIFTLVIAPFVWIKNLVKVPFTAGFIIVTVSILTTVVFSGYLSIEGAARVRSGMGAFALIV